MTSTPSDTAPRSSSTSGPAYGISGLLSAFALFLGAFQLFYRPFRLAPVALILLLISVLMSNEHQKLNRLTVAVIGVGFVVGAALQVWTHHPVF